MTQRLQVESHGCRLMAKVRGSGPPVVLIQGAGLHGDGWLPQVRALEREFSCMRIDNRGIGESLPIGPPLSVEQMADDVRVLMDAAGWEDAHIVGHSVGGLVGIELALTRPDRVRSLSLLCTSSAGRDLVRMSWWSLWVGLRMKIGPKRSRRRAFLEMVMTESQAAGVDYDGEAAALSPLFGYDLADQPMIAVKQARAARAYSAAHRLGDLPEVPTLVVTGAEDRLALPEYGAALARSIPHARHVEVPGAAHGLTIHRADEVNEILLEHLRTAEEVRGLAHHGV
jgi:pimeloyl-ACP methyl ester carboxylesterase